MRIVPITVAITMALVAAPAFANHHEGDHGTAAADAKVQDQGFMKKAAEGGMAEVAAGKLAAGKTQNAEVKAFAEMMIKDHTKANMELAALAKKHNVGLPMGPDMAHQAAAKAMGMLTGAAFDKAYVASQVKDHEQTVALFEAEAKSGTVPEAKAWAAKTLPALKMHLEHAKELNLKVQK